MRFSHLALAATTASAVLVIPEVTPEEEESLLSILPFDELTGVLPDYTAKTAVSVPCSQCLGEDARLELNFEMDHGLLFMNDRLLFPEIESAFSAVVTAQDEENYPVDLGVVIAEGHLGVDAVQDMEAIELWFTVREVDGFYMEDIPSVRVQLVLPFGVRDSFIAQIEVVEPATGPECDTFLCHAMDVFHKTLKKVKGMAKGKGCKGQPLRQGRPMMASGDEDEFRHHHHHGHHGDHHHHFGKLVRGFALQIFIPVLLGIVAGVSCGFIAMIITTLIMKVVARITGRGEPSQIVLVEESTVDEKARLMMENDDLPQYEDAPAYEQVDDKQ